VHPAVLDAYLDGTMLEGLRARAEESLVEDLKDLQPEEAAVLAMLERRLAQETGDNDLAVKRRAA
jgi:DNA topoisomerase-1